MLGRTTGRILAAAWARTPEPLRIRVVRALHPTFLCSVLGLVADDRGRLLFLDHRFRGARPRALPGGFMRPREQPAEALARELLEETGLRIAGAPTLFRAYVDPYQNNLVLVLHAALPPGEPPAIPESFEILGGCFLGPGELTEIVDDHSRDLAAEFWARR